MKDAWCSAWMRRMWAVPVAVGGARDAGSDSFVSSVALSCKMSASQPKLNQSTSGILTETTFPRPARSLISTMPRIVSPRR